MKNKLQHTEKRLLWRTWKAPEPAPELYSAI